MALQQEPVKEAFADNFRQGLERDAQLVIYKDGAVVVDIWGSSDEEGVSTAPEGGYDGDTLQIVYSSGKAIAATVMAMAVDRGLLDYDDPVAEHWPEFGQNGKEHITVADVLRHDAGLAQFHETITEDDVRNQGDPNGEMARIIAKQEPWTWSGGPDKGTTPRIYHAISRGYILSQILLRVDPQRRTVGQWMAEELCGPLGAAFFCGPSDERYAPLPEALMIRPEEAYMFANDVVPRAARAALPDKFPGGDGGGMGEEMQQLMKMHPMSDVQGRRPMSEQGFPTDDPSAKGKFLEVPSSSSRACARGMARVMAMLAGGGELDGVRLLSTAGRDKAIEGAKMDGSAFTKLQEQVMPGSAGYNVQGGWGRAPAKNRTCEHQRRLGRSRAL